MYSDSSNVLAHRMSPGLSSHPIKRKQVQKRLFTAYQQAVLNYMGYFGVSTTKMLRTSSADKESSNGEVFLMDNSTIGKCIYWILHLNATIKAIFLGFLVMDYFGPVVFLDKIAALDYILCFALIVIAGLIWFRRYPFYEILRAHWNVLDLIFLKLESPSDQMDRTNGQLKSVLLNHSTIIWVGCSCLIIQYFADPKYCTFTYSAISMDSTALRLLFAGHEFLFMNLAWNLYAASCSLCIFQGIAISTILNQMNNGLQSLVPYYKDGQNNVGDGGKHFFKQNAKMLSPKDVAPGTTYDIEGLLFDYKQLMLTCTLFNDWVAYKTLILHICGGCQFVSDVFAGIHVLKIPGAGFMDVWFYIEDCLAAGFMLIRTYMFMALVSKSSNQFLQTLNEYLTFPNPKGLQLRKVTKSLKVISLNIGPCCISPESVLTVINTMGNYYVCAALW